MVGIRTTIVVIVVVVVVASRFQWQAERARV